MKLITIVIALMLSACSTNVKLSADAAKPVEFVGEMPGKSRSQVFDTARSWVSESFDMSQMVIDAADEGAGRLIIRGKTKHPCKKYSQDCDNASIGFLLQIDCANGKYTATYKNKVIIRDGKAEPARTLGDDYDSWEAVNSLDESLRRYAKAAR